MQSAPTSANFLEVCLAASWPAYEVNWLTGELMNKATLKQAAAIADFSMGTFSDGQLRRRRAALDAASTLLLQFGERGVTMRAIAAKAHMSPGTPYNLFGSKQRILESIFEEDWNEYLLFFEEFSSDDVLNRVFAVAESSIAYCERRPEFYLALFRSLIRESESAWGAHAWAERKAFIGVVIQGAVTAGALRDDTPVELLAVTIFRLIRALCLVWVDGALDLGGARDAMGKSLCIILPNLVAPKFADSFELICSRYRG